MLNVWLDAGLDLGNHTFSHINIHRTTADAYLADVDAGAPVVRAALEARGMRLRWFRHPYLFTGETQAKHDAIAAGLAQRGYMIAPVTLDNNDWMFADVYRKAEQIGDETLKRRIGAAYVAHMATVLDFLEPYSVEITGGREPAQVLLLHANSLNQAYYPADPRPLSGARLSFRAAGGSPGRSDLRPRRRLRGGQWRILACTAGPGPDGRPIRWEPKPPAWIAAANAAPASELQAIAAGQTAP